MGGDTQERHVSLMSGVNVWLQLQKHTHYDPSLFLLAGDKVWSVPYYCALFHTAEEMLDRCEQSAMTLKTMAKHHTIARSLGIETGDRELAYSTTLEGLATRACEEGAFVFLALHGGVGEDGSVQQRLEDQGLYNYNGSPPPACALFMDKAATGVRVRDLNIDGVSTLQRHLVRAEALEDFCQHVGSWGQLQESLQF